LLLDGIKAFVLPRKGLWFLIPWWVRFQYHIAKLRFSVYELAWIAFPNKSHATKKIIHQTSTISSPFIVASDIRNVLIIKLDHIGDVYLAEQAINRLKEKFPLAKVHVMCGSWAVSLMKNITSNIIIFNYFSEKSSDLPIKPSKATIDDIKEQIEKLHIDLAIDLRCSTDTKWVLELGGTPIAPITFGCPPFGRAPRPILPPTSTVTYVGKRHSAQQLLSFVEAIPTISSYGLIWHPHKSDTKVVGINPGVGTILRQWPIQSYSEVIGELLERKMVVLLFGGEAEQADNAILMKNFEGNEGLFNFTAKISLADFAASVAQKCDVYLGNNSGPTHLVAGTGTPTIGIYGGIVDPYEWLPVGPRVKVLWYPMFCSPCYILDVHQCPYSRKCLTGVTSQDVVKTITEMLTL
jgi:ADP-heptose:LPS heptosyltransferase